MHGLRSGVNHLHPDVVMRGVVVVVSVPAQSLGCSASFRRSAKLAPGFP